MPVFFIADNICLRLGHRLCYALWIRTILVIARLAVYDHEDNEYYRADHWNETDEYSTSRYGLYHAAF